MVITIATNFVQIKVRERLGEIERSWQIKIINLVLPSWIGKKIRLFLTIATPRKLTRSLTILVITMIATEKNREGR